MKNTCILVLLLVCFSTLRAQEPECEYKTPEECFKDEKCEWDKTPECVGKFDCGILPPEKCKLTKGCVY